jgi:hypothetical protein
VAWLLIAGGAGGALLGLVLLTRFLGVAAVAAGVWLRAS